MFHKLIEESWKKFCVEISSPFKKIRLLSMTPPLNKQRKFAFKLKFSTTTTKNKETWHFFERFIYKVLRIKSNFCEDIKVIILRNINSTLLIRCIS